MWPRRSSLSPATLSSVLIPLPPEPTVTPTRIGWFPSKALGGPCVCCCLRPSFMLWHRGSELAAGILRQHTESGLDPLHLPFPLWGLEVPGEGRWRKNSCEGDELGWLHFWLTHGCGAEGHVGLAELWASELNTTQACQAVLAASWELHTCPRHGVSNRVHRHPLSRKGLAHEFFCLRARIFHALSLPVRRPLSRVAIQFPCIHPTSMQPPTHISTYACTHPCTHQCTHAFTHVCIHPCKHSFMHASNAPIHPCMHSPMYAFTHVCIHPCKHSCIHANMQPCKHQCILACTHASVHTSMHLCIHPSTHLPTHPLTYPPLIHALIYLLICPPTHSSIHSSVNPLIYLPPTITLSAYLFTHTPLFRCLDFSGHLVHLLRMPVGHELLEQALKTLQPDAIMEVLKMC